MFPATLQLFQRLSRQFSDAREWFDAVRQWYKDAKLSAGVIEQLLRGENLELLSLSLNGDDKPADVTREADGNRILLRIPSARLRVGENTLTLGLTADAEQSLELEAVQVGQPKTQFCQKIDLDALTPAPAPAFRLTGYDRAEPRAGCWELRANGHLAFTFDLHTLSRVVVELEMPRDARFPHSRARVAKQKKVLKEVGERVEEKLKAWVDETAMRDDPQAHDLAGDLRAYAELYARQIRPAIEGRGSLQATIARTGNPDATVAANARPVPLQPAVVTLVAEPLAPVYQAVRAQVLAPVYQAARVRPAVPARTPRPLKARPVDPPVPPRRGRAPVAKSGGFLGKLFVTLFLAALSAGIYAVWKNDGLGWVSRQLGVTETPSKSRGDVLLALRDTSTDLGWKPEVCQDLTDGKGDIFVAKSGSQYRGWGAPSERSFVYIAGDRRNPALEEGNGFPSADVMLVVIEFDDAATAKKHFDTLPKRFGDELRLMDLKGENTPVAIPHCDAAFSQWSEIDLEKQPGFARFGSNHKEVVVARSGRFLLQMCMTRFLTTDEQVRTLTPLAKRLNDHFPR